MGWRNQKNWREHNTPATPEQSAEWLKVNEGEVTRYVTMLPDIDTTVDRLYGVEKDTSPEFWQTMKQAQECCVKAVFFKEHDTATKKGAYVLVVDPLAAADAPIYAVPLQDVVDAADVMVQKVKDVLAERERVARLRQDLRDLHRDAIEIQQQARKDAQSLLMSIDTIARVAYGAERKSPPSLKESQLETLIKRWSRVDVYKTPVATELVSAVKLRLTIDDLVMTYSREGVRGIHKSLDGTQVHLGKFIVDIGFQERSLINNVLKEQQMVTQVYAKKPRAGLSIVHPHIKANSSYQFPDDKSMLVGSCCWGTYSDVLKQCAERGDIYGTAEVVWDYLTSCSEQGWYSHFMWWMPKAEALKFCKCGKKRSEIDPKDTACSCGMPITEDWHGGQDTRSELVFETPVDPIPTQEVR